MRILPGLTVLAPADSAQTRNVVLATWNLQGPIYYRLGKDDRIIVPGLDGRFELGRVQVLQEGSEFLLIATGAISAEAAQAAALLREKGVASTLAILPTLNPTPVEELRTLLSKHRIVMTVEAHFPSGGLGSLVAEVIAEHRVPCRLLRRCINQLPDGITGSQKFMNERLGLSSGQIAQAALAALKPSGS
jgi:transketolase